jgi:alcohol dehydrogenase class IV
MIRHEKPLKTYLEGVGSEKPTGEKVPFIAVPTTAGTGSEASKNAVISEIGPEGFKKSLRHDNFVPDIAVIDPELALSCPASVTAASGLDAITQIIEGYVSTKSSPMTDSLSVGGLKAAGRSFEKAVTDGTDLEARADMAYAAYISGVVLANAGLGVVHGIAGPLGGLHPVPHGVVCGTLIGEATRMIIDNLFEMGDEGFPALRKYAEAGTFLRAINKSTDTSAEKAADRGNIREKCDLLIETLRSWVDRYKIPKLGEYGIEEQHLGGIAKLSGLKNTPVELSKQEIITILKKRL